jgi:nucleoside-diphosphate-sugar epimerase
VNFVLPRVKKLCYVSSTAALGDLASETIITEEIEWNPKKPHSDYAISKYGAEMEIWRSARRVRCNNCKSRNFVVLDSKNREAANF